MSLILHINTATANAHVSMARNGLILQSLNNNLQKDHASFLQVAIKQLVNETGITLTGLDAIAVTAGPGSYTGLRVGMASAKGLCYALDKPLITINTLLVLAASAKLPDTYRSGTPAFLCPMIDARRQEVFTALYNLKLEIILSPCAMILNETSFNDRLFKDNILFFGSGSEKWKLICHHHHASFIKADILAESMSRLTEELYLCKNFTELIESQPIYLKDHITVIKNSEIS